MGQRGWYKLAVETSGSLRIAVVGGVPAPLGGGGLETQARSTVAALQRRGHEVFHVEREPAARPFDVLHAIGADIGVGHALLNWRRNPAPLVLSPVIVVKPGVWEWRQWMMGHLPIPLFGPHVRHQLVRMANLVVAQTDHEAHLIRTWSLPARPEIIVIPNGVEPLPAREPPPGLPAGYVLLLGAISRRKRQQQTLAELGRSGIPAVVAGGFEGSSRERARFEATVQEAQGLWLGEVNDRETVAGLLRGARALVHLSSAEGQSLAVIESLSVGTPALISPLPANRELAARYPDLVRLVSSAEAIPQALAELPDHRRPAAVATWEEVASRLERQYRNLVDKDRTSLARAAPGST